jgi:hypothetical protein
MNLIGALMRRLQHGSHGTIPYGKGAASDYKQ